jgi:hypothetical protein
MSRGHSAILNVPQSLATFLECWGTVVAIGRMDDGVPESRATSSSEVFFGLLLGNQSVVATFAPHAGTPLPSRPEGGLGWVDLACFAYAESTTSTTGRPLLRLGIHWSTNKRHQRSQPAGMQMRATS